MISARGGGQARRRQLAGERQRVSPSVVWSGLVFAWLLISLPRGGVGQTPAPAGSNADPRRAEVTALAGFQAFFEKYCYDCHADGTAEGGLDLSTISLSLQNEQVFAKWERIYDRVLRGEMPPTDATTPAGPQRAEFCGQLEPLLIESHRKRRETVLRRLNRREYEHTLNDLFGTHLDLAGHLPTDALSHEFDNVGAALGISQVHLQRYLDAIERVLDAAVESTSVAPTPQAIKASYLETREAEQFLGKKWKQLPDGAVVRFSGGGYPSGMMRGSNVREAGRYRVQVTGYAHQSDQPITFSVGGTSFARGSEKPIYGFWSFPPGQPGQSHSIEFEAWIERNYMIAIEPYGIADPQRYQRESIADYAGPGLAIVNVTLEGPLIDSFPSRGHQLVFEGLDRREIPPRNPADRKKRWYQPKFEILVNDEAQEVERVLLRVASAAFRCDAQPADIQRFVTLYQRTRESGAAIEDALRTAVAALFCSPRFLYFQESPGRLDDHALAARLSYFLTRTTPDPELLRQARDGKLSGSREVLRQQTERLLNDPRFERFLADFADNWLDLRDLDFTVPDGQLYPEYDDFLRYSMPLETIGFLQTLISDNLPVKNLVRSDFAMLNSRLADHYGLPSVVGAEIRRVDLPSDSVRGGLLSQASILKVTANGTNSSPVTRGAWVMERILGEPPPPPPPGIPGVEPDIRGSATLREILARHRSVSSCQACHQKIDPPGFALESFNPIGGFRQRYRSLGDGDRVATLIQGRRVGYRIGPAVDSSGQFEDFTFADFREFRDHLARDERRLARAFAQKLLTFATGRELGFSDRAEVARLVAQAEAQSYRLRDLIHGVVQSEIFLNK